MSKADQENKAEQELITRGYRMIKGILASPNAHKAAHRKGLGNRKEGPSQGSRGGSQFVI